jgi:uncharacterized protein (TIGR02421 family)
VSQDPSSAGKSETLSPQLIDDVRGRLLENRRVRRSLPQRGRLHVDRQLPFLCVYRRPVADADTGTDHLVTSEASYLVVSGEPGIHPRVSELVRSVVATLADEFGAFLILELWAEPWDSDSIPIPALPAAMRPHFRVHVPADNELGGFADTLENALSRIKAAKQSAVVELVASARRRPPEMSALLSAAEGNQLKCLQMGLEVRPVYRNPRTGELYPLVLRELRRGLTRALRRCFYAFACTHTTQSPVHYHVLGRRAMVKAVWDVDRRLAKVSDAFDFLLQVTPVNADKAWRRFQRNRFAKAPVFHYRPLPVDPVLLKRRLYEIPLERVEDPALWQLFREKQEELDRRLTMLLDMNTPRFLLGSIQLFGPVDQGLVQLAGDLLAKLPPRARDDTKAGYLDVTAFRRRAVKEIERYRRQWSKVNSRVEVRADIAGGLMVSRGSLLIAQKTRIPVSRADALLAHEVGTHVLTYFNGRAQPFRQLYSGLAGYEPLQEGLAVFAEYLVGGLSRPRLRLLAARVLAARLVIDGASFAETFRELDETYDLDQRTAFMTAMRVYRAGGLTKDAVYLRGLRELLDHLAGGGALEPLFVGKMGIGHVPIIRELQYRRVLEPAPLRPRYLDAPGAAERLERARAGLTFLQLIERTAR